MVIKKGTQIENDPSNVFIPRRQHAAVLTFHTYKTYLQPSESLIPPTQAASISSETNGRRLKMVWMKKYKVRIIFNDSVRPLVRSKAITAFIYCTRQNSCYIQYVAESFPAAHKHHFRLSDANDLFVLHPNPPLSLMSSFLLSDFLHSLAVSVFPSPAPLLCPPFI